MLEECQILLCLQKINLEVQEAILSEELERSLRPSDGRDLLVELDEACAHMNGIDS
jgi:hypothetical protein